MKGSKTIIGYREVSCLFFRFPVFDFSRIKGANSQFLRNENRCAHLIWGAHPKGVQESNVPNLIPGPKIQACILVLSDLKFLLKPRFESTFAIQSIFYYTYWCSLELFVIFFHLEEKNGPAKSTSRSFFLQVFYSGSLSGIIRRFLLFRRDSIHWLICTYSRWRSIESDLSFW